MSDDFENGLAELMEKNAKADAKADSFLDKVKNSEWTPVILTLGGVAIVALLILAWLVG